MDSSKGYRVDGGVDTREKKQAGGLAVELSRVFVAK